MLVYFRAIIRFYGLNSGQWSVIIYPDIYIGTMWNYSYTCIFYEGMVISQWIRIGWGLQQWQDYTMYHVSSICVQLRFMFRLVDDKNGIDVDHPAWLYSLNDLGPWLCFNDFMGILWMQWDQWDQIDKVSSLIDFMAWNLLQSKWNWSGMGEVQHWRVAWLFCLSLETSHIQQ